MPHRKSGSNGKAGGLPGAVTRRILLLAAPGTQILDLVGPYQVFTRASEIAARTKPMASSLYSLQVVTTEPGMLLTSCGLRLEAHQTFRQVRGTVDTLLVVGGASVEAGEEDSAVVESLRRMAPALRLHCAVSALSAPAHFCWRERDCWMGVALRRTGNTATCWPDVIHP